MPLVTGTKLGPYEIVAPLGAGGMGEVYRARDTRLGRDVAIKILPQHLADNPGFRERFEREARSISNLSHSNICTLYDIGHEGDISYIVLEYLEGETLEKRLERGPLPSHQILKFAIQIADALAKAHQSGIVHRDLKPGNIMLTKSGAKLMDFGLARDTKESPIAAALTELTVEDRKLTADGSLIGTFQYMAPEQLEGQAADERTDIFALGAVMYEMATAKPAFNGKTKASLIAAILSAEPPAIAATQPMAPPALDRVVRTCLSKSPADRFQSAHDLKLQLEWIAEAGSQAGVPVPIAEARKRRTQWVIGLAVAGWLVAAVALMFASMYNTRWHGDQKVMRTALLPPTGVDWPLYPGPMVVSSDGHYLAFLGNDGKQTAIWVQDLVAGTQQKLAGTEGAIYPFWSPDNTRLGFFENGKLETISAGGGPIAIVCDAADGRGGSWSPAGWIVFTPTINEAIYKVPAGGGTPVAITKKPPKDGTARNPNFLPDGKHFLFAYRDDTNSAKPASIYAGSLNGEPQKMVVEEGSNAYYYDGRIVYFRDGNLVTQAFDPDSLKVSGSPVAIAEHIEYWRPRDMGNFALSATGLLFYRHQPLETDKLVWVDAAGHEIGDASDPIEGVAGILLSPDGNLVALSRVSKDTLTQDVWLLNLERRTLSRVTLEGTGVATFAFSPDGRTAAFAHSFGGKTELVLRSLHGSGDSTLPWNPNAAVTDWSHDGKYLIVDQQNPDTKEDIYMMNLEGDHKLIPVVHSPASELNGTVSPNGKWLAYNSDESGRQEVYVTALPGPGTKWQVSNSGGEWPQWGRDGKSLFYAGGTKLMKVDVMDADAMQLGATHELFDVAQGGANSFAISQFQVAPDGKRFLLTKPVGSKSFEPIQVVTHWTQLLAK